MRISDWSSDVCSSDLLVPEHPPDLEHPLEAADREALQVELGRDPQEEVEIERVVVGGERAGQRATGDRVQRRRLDLEEPAIFEPATGEAQDEAALEDRLAALRVGPPVDIALPVAGVYVDEAVHLVAAAVSGIFHTPPRRN